ncbi:hypothetical protein NQ318_003705 [Aromia moschata]|uniref:Ras-related protein Rab-36 n=1 Tax=Aromia moschata TaxID=1265417 RepID=A0AAV8YIW3_9CUCU|nr:hypothetical protein NQ318_003705 [Aromia moschata]
MPQAQRSSIFKMLKDQAPEDRQINIFPGPYKPDCTPYQKFDFSESTYKKCLEEQETAGVTWLKLCKVIVIGDTCVGKTCIVNRFCRRIFDANYKSTIGVDFEVERFDVLNVAYNLQIWDTAGQERFKSIAQSYYRAAHVIIVVFDLTSLQSLHHCQTWLREALTASHSMCPFIFLVGSKRDLLKKYAYRNVEINAIKVAEKLNAEYWPVSSKTGKNVNNLFYRIAALTFDNFMRNEHELRKASIEIGRNLIKFNKKSGEHRPKKCL